MRLVLLLLAAPAFAQQSPLLACPDSIRLTPAESIEAPAGWRALPAARTHWLRGARLFAGDPAEQAELIPNFPRARNYGWTLDTASTLVCEYEGTEATIAAPVPAGAGRCNLATYFDNARGLRNGAVVIGPNNWVRVQCR